MYLYAKLSDIKGCELNMITNRKYICECGKEFNNSQSFNGHKSHCIVHLKKNNKLEKHTISEKRRIEKLKQTYNYIHLASLEKKKQLLQQWVLEQHKCEHCGKIMIEKFGNGRFCCRACANAHHISEEQKIKISKSLVNHYKSMTSKHLLAVEQYNRNPNRCSICGKILPWNKRNNITCCKECHNISNSRKMIDICSQRNESLCGKGKRGWYKGYYCQSSWELAFVIYCIDLGVSFIRNKDGFKYLWKGIQRTYFPDFYLTKKKVYVEIKGYCDQRSKEKANQFPKDKKIKVYCKDDMKPILEYVINKYGKNYVDLYERIV